MGGTIRQGLFEGMPAPWSSEDTVRYLNRMPLPPDFTWRGLVVQPRYQIKKGYGFWLRTTPYHPGLFEHVNRYVARCEELPEPEAIAAAMNEIEEAEAARQTEFGLEET